MKKILVPTDFSSCADAAVDLAIYLAEKSKAEIHFLHLLMTPVDWVKLPLEKEDLYPETKEQISKARFELDQLSLRAEKKNLTVQKSLVLDKGKEELSKHLNHYSHDFIVIGSHGTSEMNDHIGTNTQKVVRYSTTPVLVVKESIGDPKFRNIVFACAFDEDVDAPFAKVLDFAELMDAHVYLLYINTPYDFRETEEMENKMMELMSHCKIGACSINIYNSYDEESGIRRFAHQVNADLIVMSTHGKKGFIRMISPSITESIVNHAKLPVLCVNFSDD